MPFSFYSLFTFTAQMPNMLLSSFVYSSYWLLALLTPHGFLYAALRRCSFCMAALSSCSALSLLIRCQLFCFCWSFLLVSDRRLVVLFLLFLVFVLLILLILILILVLIFLLQPLTQSKVISRFVIRRVVSQTFLIRLYGIAI